MDAMAGDSSRDDMLVLVDGLDRPVGTATKEEAHRGPLLHRAFSVVLVRPGRNATELLLAQRAQGKYHCGGLWANSCCSHPRAGENLKEAAYRRVREELGCEARNLHEVGVFTYLAPFPNGLCEFEYDHVLIGGCDGALAPDPAEVGATRWVDFDSLATELADYPEHFAPWAFAVLTMAMRACSVL